MDSIADGSVNIQTSSLSVPSTPAWFGEVVLLIAYLRKQGVLDAITSRVRFARRRFGHYEVIDFLAVLFGSARSFERTLEQFYEQLLPFAQPFMALFDRERLPSRSALSRFLGSLSWEATEALRTLFTGLISTCWVQRFTRQRQENTHGTYQANEPSRAESGRRNRCLRKWAPRLPLP